MTRLPVHCEHFGNSGRMRFRRGSEHSFNCIRDSRERDAPREECLDRNFVRGVERNAMRASFFRSFIGQAKARKSVFLNVILVIMSFS